MVNGRHPVPGFATVAAAQARLLWHLRHRGVLIFVVLLGIQTVAVAGFGIVFGLTIDIGEEHRSIGFARVADLGRAFGLGADPGGFAVLVALAALVVFACFWPLGVWSEEQPRHRDYHRSLPVDRQLLDLVRVAAGALGLLLVSAAVYGAALLTAGLAGHTAAIAALSPAAWACLLLGPLVPYGLCSIAAVRSEHPAGWLWGIVGAAGVAATVAFGLAWRPLANVVRELTIGPWGLLHATAGGALGELIARMPSGATGWLPAWALWLAFALAGLVAAAGRGRAG